jgi:hypothetical protein
MRVFKNKSFARFARRARIGERAFFVHGFAKNEQDNIRDDELTAFKLLAAEMMAYDDETLARAIANGTLTEVMCND